MKVKVVTLAALALIASSSEVVAQSRALFAGKRQPSRSILTSSRSSSHGHTTHVSEMATSGCSSCGGGGCTSCCPPALPRLCIPIIPQVLDEIDCVVRAFFSCTRPAPHCDIRDPGGSRVLLPQLSRRQCCDQHGPREVWIEGGTPLPKPAPEKATPTPAKKSNKSAGHRSYMPSVRYQNRRLSYRRGSIHSRGGRTAQRSQVGTRYRSYLNRSSKHSRYAGGRGYSQQRRRSTSRPTARKYSYTYPRWNTNDTVGTSVRRPTPAKRPAVANRARTIRQKVEPAYRSVKTTRESAKIRRTSVSENETVRKAPRRIDVDDEAKPIEQPKRTVSGRVIPVNPLR